MSYQSWSVVFGEQPSAAKWNILGTNDASFADSSGLILSGSKASNVATSQTSASTSYTDLATSGPAVTAVIGASGMALIILSASLLVGTAAAYTFMSFAASGANTIAASDTQSLFLGNNGVPQDAFSWAKLLTGLTPGSTTFTLKYRVTGGTGSWGDRNLALLTL